MSVKTEYTGLIVFPDSEQVEAFKAVKHAPKFKEAKNLKMISTCNDDFLEGELKDTYDFTLFVFMEEVDQDELELKSDLITYYAHVPVTDYFMPKSMESKSEEELSGLLGYIKQNLEKYLVNPVPCFVDFADVNNAAIAIYERVEQMISKYDEIYTNEVKPAFDKFDKDGSGAIDKSELSQLSLELGHPLDGEQLEKALKDLDLNKDGVVDLNEFSRWYFTGLKSYNDGKRNMLLLGNAGLSLSKALAANQIFAIVSKDKSLNSAKAKI